MKKDSIDLFRVADDIKSHDYSVEYKENEIVATISVLKDSYVSVDLKGNVSVVDKEENQTNKHSFSIMEETVRSAAKREITGRESDVKIGGISFDKIIHNLVSSFDAEKKMDENTPEQVMRNITFYDKDGKEVVSFSAEIGKAEDDKWSEKYGMTEPALFGQREHAQSGVEIWEPLNMILSDCTEEELADIDQDMVQNAIYVYPMLKEAVAEADKELADLAKEPTPYTNGYRIRMSFGDEYENDEICAKVYNRDINRYMKEPEVLSSWVSGIEKSIKNSEKIKEAFSHIVSFKEHTHDEYSLPSHDFDVIAFPKTVDPYKSIVNSLNDMNKKVRRLIIDADKNHVGNKLKESLCNLEEISYGLKKYIDSLDAQTKPELCSASYLEGTRISMEHAIDKIKSDLEKAEPNICTQKIRNTIDSIEKNLDNVFRLDKAIEMELGGQLQDTKVELSAQNINTVMDFMKAPKYNKELLSVIDKANFTGDERFTNAKAEAEKILDTNRDIAKHLCREISAIKDSRNVTLEQAVERLSDVYTSLDNTKTDFNVEEMFEAMIKNMPEVYDRLSVNEREANTYSFSKDTMSFDDR